MLCLFKKMRERKNIFIQLNKEGFKAQRVSFLI